MRIFTISELGTRVGRRFPDGSLHRNGGVVFLSFAVLVIAVLLWALRAGEERKLLARTIST
jgi:hypothetical protein